jgi:cation:H+ antiporter
VKAALQHRGDLALGNVVGSNIFNIGAILGITALLAPMRVQFQLIKIDAPILLAVSLGVVGVLWDGRVGQCEGAVLLAGLIAYVAGNVWIARRTATVAVEQEFAEGVPTRSGSVVLDILFILGGLGVLVLGARWLTEHSVELARGFGVSEAVIGLTIVAAGTGVPELAASIVAAIKKEPDIALGNVIGSNIFNILGVLGVASLLAPLSAPAISRFDLWTMVGMAAVLVPMLWTGLRVSRVEGGALFAVYCGYLFLLWPK